MICRILHPRHRSYQQIFKYLSTYPSHQVVGMPALSPTMTNGTISSWKKAAGDFVAAGETIAEVETDKAVIAFDSVDEMYIAKHLVAAGAEVAVGTPIMVTVDNLSDVAAFASFTVSTTSTPLPVVPPTPKESTSSQTPPPPAPPTPTPVKAATPTKPTPSSPSPPSPPPKSVNASATLPPPTPTPPPSPRPPTGKWGQHILNSPLLQKLIQEQTAYQTKYGTGLQQPLKVGEK